jgi:hypothetical protein
VLDQRGQLLRAAVGLAECSMPSYDRALHALRFWLDSWSGIGHITVGMARQGYDLQLTRYDEKGWRARETRARETLDNAPSRVISSPSPSRAEVRHGTAAVDLPPIFQGHLT